jgi:ATP-dependent 26S proteasome regulatory subunit
MLRVLALEHLLASRSPADRNAEDNGMLPTFGEVMLPSEEARGRCARVGSDGEAESAAHRRDGQEIETGRCGDGDSQKHVARDRPRKFRAGLHLFRGVDGDGAVVPISSGDESAAGGEGRGAMGRRVRMAVSRARPDAIVPRQHVLLSRVMRLQLDAAIGSWIAVSRLRVATARGGDKAGTPGVTGNADGENISESEEEEAVLTPAKICIQRVLLTGATASESGDGGERARLGSSPEQQDNSSRQDKQDGGQVRGRAPLKELLLKWLAVNAPVKKRRLCVSDSVLLALPHDAQYAAGDAEIDGSACSKNSTLACLSFRQGNDHVYAAGSSVCYFGLWLQGVTEAVVEEGADVVWGEWTEHVSLSPKLSDVESLGEVTSRVISHLRVSLLSERRRAKLIGSSFGAPGSLLIYGSPGCGKTLLCRALAHMVSAEWARKCGGVDEAVGRVGGGRCYAEVVACREMGRSGEQRAVAVMSKLEAAFKRARRRSPALLVLDDIDVVAPAISSQGQGEVGADASARIRAQGQLLIDMMRELGASKKRVAVVATAKTLASVNVATLAGGLFDAQIEIPAPDRHARVAILRRMLQAAPVASSPLLDVSVLIHELDGFTPHDLNILTIRAAAAAAARALESPSDSTSPINMTEADLKSARQGFVPPALRGAQARENVPWESVAGMNAAKDTLLQLVLLPTKYPDIFATAPLRVRSGALLLGYPGCGKTMLVAALATKTGLNFISVKGPELLNKYIGQSGDE